MAASKPKKSKKPKRKWPTDPGKLSHPMQPVYKDSIDQLMFKSNPIVRFLLDAGPFNMNMLAIMPWSDDDRAQFAQLIGYSLAGYQQLPYVSASDYATVASILEVNSE